RGCMALTAGLLALACVELFSKPVGDLLLSGTPVAMDADVAAPSAEFVEALKTRLSPGAVLDLPFGPLRYSSHAIFLAAYHERAVAACYNSWSDNIPVAADVGRMAARLPDPSALTTLRVIGFGSIVVHGDLMPSEERNRLAAAFAAAESAGTG